MAAAVEATPVQKEWVPNLAFPKSIVVSALEVTAQNCAESKANHLYVERETAHDLLGLANTLKVPRQDKVLVLRRTLAQPWPPSYTDLF